MGLAVTPLSVTLNEKETNMSDKQLTHVAWEMHHALRFLISDPCPAHWIQAGKAIEAYEEWVRNKYDHTKPTTALEA